MKIYADNSSTTKMSRNSINTMLLYMEKIYGNPSNLHSIGQESAEALNNARKLMAKYLCCHANEIYFNSSGTEADNQAILTAAAFGEKKGKMHIISSKIEHHAILHALKRLEKDGFDLTLLDVDDNGMIEIDELDKAIRKDTAFVSIIYANNEIGTIQPILKIGDVCKNKGVLFHTDAVQAIGHIPINVREQNIDMLSLSAHKFHGPKGVGMLFVREGIPLTNIIVGGAQERGKRAGTENIPAIMGMAEAFKDACEQMKDNSVKITKLRDKLIDGLSNIPHIILNGDRNCRLPGNVNFCFSGIEGESLLMLLDRKGICASSGSACASGSLDPSHVLLAIGRSRNMAQSSLRISLSKYNTEEEVDHILKVVPEVIENLRNISPVWRDLENTNKTVYPIYKGG